MFTEIGAVLGMVSFILIVISSIIKTFTDEKSRKMEITHIKCDIEYLKNCIKDIEFELERKNK